MTSVSSFVSVISTNIINPILELIFASGLLLFLVGVVQFLIALYQGNNDVKKKGQQHLLWGVLGMFVMLSAVAILHFIGSIACQNGSLTNCFPTSTNNGGGSTGGGGGSTGGGGGSTGGGGGSIGGGGGSTGNVHFQ